MSTTAFSPVSPVDIPPTPQERLREVAAILAAGLLRLRTRPGLAPGAAVPGAPDSTQTSTAGQHAAPEKAAESGGNPLASLRT